MGYKKERIGKYVDLKQGFAVNAKSNHHISIKRTDLPLLRIADMRDDIYSVFVKNTIPQTFIASQDDIIYTRTGQVGLVFTNKYGIVHNNCFRVIPNEEFLHQKYLFYALQNREVYVYANALASGSAQPDLPHDSFKKIKIYIPTIKQQDKIASILSTYDDLIEKNNHKIEILQEMAEELYKEWFVRFRFPGYKTAKFTNGIPDGWEVKRCGDISTIKAGGDAPKEYSEIKTDKYKYPIFSNGISEDGLYGYTDKPSIKTESITISARGTVGFVCLRNEPYLPIVRLLVIVPNTEIVSSSFLYMYFKHNTTEGYGTSQQQITVPYFKKKKILLPNKELISKYTGYIEPFFNEIRKLKIINDNLKQQRDLLLPRLMSGKLEVKVS